MEVKKTINQNIKQYYYEEDEIDLYELWFVLKKRKFVILITTLISLLISLFFILNSKPIYESSFILKLHKFKNEDMLTTYDIKKLIDDLNMFLKEKKYEELAHLLNLDVDDVKKIHRISVNTKKSIKTSVEIKIELLDNKLFPKIEKSIYLYLNNNRFIKEKIENEIEKIKKSIKNISLKLNDIENVRNYILRKIKNGNITELGFNPQDLDIKIISLKDRLASLKIYLKEINGLKIFKHTYIPNKPSKPKKKLILAVSIISGIFLGIFLAFFLEWLENAKRRHQEENLENEPTT